MSLTKGNLYSRKREYHVFTTEDIGLANFGLSSYNVSSIDHIKQTLSAPTSQTAATTTTAAPQSSFAQEIDAYFDTDVNDVLGSLICSGEYAPNGNPKIMHFDTGSLVYVEQSENNMLQITQSCDSSSTSPTGILQFLKAYNEAVSSKNSTTSENFKRTDILNLAQKIQNSLSGCITFSIKYKALGCERIVPIKLRLLDKENSDDRRIIATRDAPVIAGIPREITGREYSFNGTNEAPMGVYQNPYEGGIDNPKNTVAGQLDIRYNKTTGKWQSGTHQILARLITDVDSAKIGATDNIDLITSPSSRPSVYTVGNSLNISQFTTGQAIPLSMENGNPYMYGPNYIGCTSNIKEVEKMNVVNRSNRIFKKGDVVLASQIDGEWIIQGFDLPTTSNKTSGKNWQFQKYIVNSDSFFKDGRFLEDNSIVDIDPKVYLQTITPDIYETKIRKRYYNQILANFPNTFNLCETSDKNYIARINFFIEEENLEVARTGTIDPNQHDIVLSSGYYQTSSFDQLGSYLGGTNTNGNVISRTNIYKPLPFQTSDPALIYQTDLPHFWGAVFPDGYTSRSVGELKKKENIPIKINNTNFNQFFNNSNDTLRLNANDDATTLGMLSDSQDFNYVQLPADVALNGPPVSGLPSSIKEKFSAPIERIYITRDQQKNLFRYFYDQVSGKDKERYSYLLYEKTTATTTTTTAGTTSTSTTSAPATSVILEPLFDLKPINPNRIQFSPLQLQTALNSHKITNTSKFEYIQLQTEINGSKSQQFFKKDETDNKNLIWPPSFISRNGLDINSPITFFDTNSALVIGTGPIQFGPYVKFPKFSSSPTGGPNLIPKENLSYEKSNLIGIVASKNSFSATNQVNFTVKQNFGLPRKVTVTGAGALALTILGPFIGWSSQNGPSSPQQRGIPQWGDRERTDAVSSFGTTALHVRIFDEWPDNQTYYDGRYFAVLHFNPAVPDEQPSPSQIENLKCIYGGNNFISAKRENTVLIVELDVFDNDGNKKRRQKNIIETSVDFTEPTLEDGTILSNNTIVDSFTKLLPIEYWKINPVRRGALLTGGGFRYLRKTIGLHEGSISIKNNPENNEPMSGTGYENGDIINFPNGAKVEVKIEDGGSIQNGSFKLIDPGSGFTDFKSPVLSTGGGSGTGAVLSCSSGKVYYQNGIDLGPQQRCPITRLTSSSDQGNKVVDNDQKTTIALDGNGKYDAFYFMHNDILHTLLFSTNFTAGEAQHLTLEIS